MSPPPDLDLGELLRATAGGDQQAFALLYDSTGARVHGLVVRILRDHAQAEEVTQEVYLQVWRTASSFDPTRGSARSWLLTLAHRRAVDRVRSAQAQSDRDQAYESRHDRPAPDPTAEEVEHRMQGQAVRSAVQELGPPHQEALELAYFEGLTHREVSERLGVPLGTAKTRIRDGLRRLRDQMGGRA
ncbi:ECF RNA polymerase sigma factor SigK [Ornithinimicrobium sediminis]|uniref:ECF RNA polymerase sigma factor SigK n=1 Tax=Ornithinimicrobium sediminis TaxID=2904603 RepID=UPI001E4C4A82|nr:ECF RNA polymerase sigma factor SigK [Ornithinimicrobium sediminis]MCE0488003.1 ECF RNA polymerase sigma factor SigK [Ornithinimicrobium sediminis]